MSTETSKPRALQPPQDIGTRQRRAFESTYGLPNHEDGIQSGDLTGDDSSGSDAPNDGNTSLTGPGATHSSGLEGQKALHP